MTNERYRLPIVLLFVACQLTANVVTGSEVSQHDLSPGRGSGHPERSLRRWLVPSAAPLAAGGPLTSQEIRDAADRVMQQRDFRSVRRRVLENVPDTASDSGGGFLGDTLGQMGRAVGDFLEWLFSGLSNPGTTRPGSAQGPAPTANGFDGLSFGLGNMLLYVGLATLIGISIWIIASVIRSRDRKRERDSAGLFDVDEWVTDLSVPPGELAVSTYESRAIQMAADGNFRGAIRELLIGGMSWIERAGLIRFRKGLTNRDYLRAIWREQDRRLAYDRTARQFERVFFGRRAATPEMFEECLQSFQRSFRDEETTPAEV